LRNRKKKQAGCAKATGPILLLATVLLSA